MLHFLGYHSVYHFGSLASLIFLGNIEEDLNKGLRIRQTYLAYLFFFFSTRHLFYKIGQVPAHWNENC